MLLSLEEQKEPHSYEACHAVNIHRMVYFWVDQGLW